MANTYRFGPISAEWIDVNGDPIDIVKAEDAAHSSGDRGIMLLAVRKDTAAALAGTDADYIPLIVDASGRLHVNVGAGTITATGPLTDAELRASAVPVSATQLPAALGQAAMAASLPVVVASDQSAIPTVGKTVAVSQTPTITAGAYTAKDAVGGLLTFANAARVSGGAITIQQVTITDLSTQAADLMLVLFDRTFTPTADNAAFDPSDADLANAVAIIPIYSAEYQAFADNCMATKVNVGAAMVLNGTSLFGQLMCLGAPTYASVADLTVKLTVYQD